MHSQLPGLLCDHDSTSYAIVRTHVIIAWRAGQCMTCGTKSRSTRVVGFNRMQLSWACHQDSHPLHDWLRADVRQI